MPCNSNSLKQFNFLEQNKFADVRKTILRNPEVPLKNNNYEEVVVKKTATGKNLNLKKPEKSSKLNQPKCNNIQDLCEKLENIKMVRTEAEISVSREVKIVLKMSYLIIICLHFLLDLLEIEFPNKRNDFQKLNKTR